MDKYLRNVIKPKDEKARALDELRYTTVSEAVRRIFEEDDLARWTTQFDLAQDWRNQRYWNQECEKVLKSKQVVIKGLFEFASFLNPKKAFYRFMFMTSKDLVPPIPYSKLGLISLAGLVNDSFGDKDIYLAFLLSIMTQIDEVNSMRHSQMTLIEFMEALARVSEKLSLVP
jgi:hypothetical protein